MPKATGLGRALEEPADGGKSVGEVREAGGEGLAEALGGIGGLSSLKKGKERIAASGVSPRAWD